MDFRSESLVTARSGRKYFSVQLNAGMWWMPQSRGQQLVLHVPLTGKLPSFLVLPHAVVILLLPLLLRPTLLPLLPRPILLSLLLRPALLPLVPAHVPALAKFVLTCPHRLPLNRMTLVIPSLSHSIIHLLLHSLACPPACPHRLPLNRMTLMILSFICNIIHILVRSFAHPLVRSLGCPPARSPARQPARTPARSFARHLARSLAHQSLLLSTCACLTPCRKTMKWLIRWLSMFPRRLKGLRWFSRGWCVFIFFWF
jgi:hypothetical protein